MELPWKSLTFTFIIIILNSQLTHGARGRVKTTFVRRYLPFPVVQTTTPRELNTSVAFTVPLLSLSTDTPVFDLLPWGIPPGTRKLIMVIAISAVIFSLAVIFLSPSVAVLSAILEQHNQLTSSGRSVDGLSSFMTNRLSDLLHTLAYNPFNGFPGIDLDECVKKSICEAHNRPSSYGLMAFPFKLFFPPYIGVPQDNDPSQLSKYQLAARYGKSNNANCGLQYQGCMFNPVNVFRKIVGWFFGKKIK